MNRHLWYPLPREVERLWAWIAQQDPTVKCRYDVASIQQSLNIMNSGELLDRIKQLEKYNREVEPNHVIVMCAEYAGACYVDIKDAAQWTWREYETEKNLRTCPSCGKTERKQIAVMWCPHCNQLDPPPRQ